MRQTHPIWRFTFGWLATAALAAGCTLGPAQDASLTPSSARAPEASTVADAWEYLRRPMFGPRPGPCEPAAGRIVSDKFAEAFGTGPVYPVFGGVDRAVLTINPAWKQDGGWPIKTLWVARPTFAGRVLVRGVGSDGTRLRFGHHHELDVRIQWKGDPAGEWREGGTNTWVTAPGCYQWQVDFDAGTMITVFEVRSET
jgi:hypothetical protein